MVDYYENDLLKLDIRHDGGVLTNISLVDEIPADYVVSEEGKPIIQQLKEYFWGARKNFELEYLLTGTPFQREVLQAVARIPYGETRSYKQIAIQIGRTGAARAVGNALNRNPLPLVIPCHRVVGSRGELTGFRGGVTLKQLLLNLEQEKGL